MTILITRRREIKKFYLKDGYMPISLQELKIDNHLKGDFKWLLCLDINKDSLGFAICTYGQDVNLLVLTPDNFKEVVAGIIDYSNNYGDFKEFKKQRRSIINRENRRWRRRQFGSFLQNENFISDKNLLKSTETPYSNFFIYFQDMEKYPEKYTRLDLSRFLYWLCGNRGFPGVRKTYKDLKNFVSNRDIGIHFLDLLVSLSYKGDSTKNITFRQSDIYTCIKNILTNGSEAWGLDGHLINKILSSLFLNKVNGGYSDSVNNCILFENTKVARSALYITQKFNINLSLDNVRINDEELDQYQRDILFNKLYCGKRLLMDDVRKILNLSDTDYTNLDDSKFKLVFNSTEEKFIEQMKSTQFLDTWISIPLEKKEVLVEELFSLNNNSKSLFNKTKSILGISDEEFILSVVEGFKELKRGRSCYSQKSMKLYLNDKPRFLKLQRLYENNKRGSIECINTDKVDVNKAITGLYDRVNNTKNGNVRNAISQFVKLFKVLVEKLGEPSYIVIESGKDFFEETKESKEYRLKQESLSREAKEYLKSKGFSCSGTNIKLYKIWCQQKRSLISILTGDVFTEEDIFGDTKTIQICHITPNSNVSSRDINSLFLDKERANKDMGKNTPYEAFSGKKRKEIFARAKNVFSTKKYELFTSKEVESVFKPRDLHDMCCVSNAISDALRSGNFNVRQISGKLTALIRDSLGLEKDRSDIRHHAQDALVMSFLTPKIIERLNHFSSREVYIKRNCKRIVEVNLINSNQFIAKIKKALGNDKNDSIDVGKNVVFESYYTKKAKGLNFKETRYKLGRDGIFYSRVDIKSLKKKVAVANKEREENNQEESCEVN